MISLKGLFKRKTLNDNGERLYKAIAEKFVTSSQECFLDFDGISHISVVFFQDFIFPIIVEFGSEAVCHRLKFINIKDEHMAVYRVALSKSSEYMERMAANNTSGIDDLSDITFELLIKARELSRHDPSAAMVMFGFSKEMVAIFSTMDIRQIRRISAAGIICFEPRFTAEFASKLATLNTSEVEIFLNIIGDIQIDAVFESESH
jgi:hypothetical protein